MKTTEIYAHAAKIGNAKGVRSPLDAVGARHVLEIDLGSMEEGFGTGEDEDEEGEARRYGE